jgi:hypothetical protein
MLGDTRRATALIDLIAWPPVPVPNRGEFVVSFDTLPDGRFVVSSMLTKPPGEYAIRVHPPEWAADPTAGPTEVYPVPAGLTNTEVWAVAGRVMTFEWLITRTRPPAARRAYLLDGNQFVPAPGLPPVGKFGRGTSDGQVHANGKVALATGADVLVWDGDGYEWTGTKFEKRWELGARNNYFDWSAVPWGADGFFYLSDRRVMYARRGKRPVRVHPDAENVVMLSPGPGDSVILKLGQNRKSHVARAWFPADGSYISILRGHLGWQLSGATPELYWSAATKHFYFETCSTFPDSALAAIKPIKPRGKGYQIEKA